MPAAAYHPVDRELARQTILTPDGQIVRLSTIWAERPAVVVFLRQFMCLFCCEQVARFDEWHSEFDRAGFELVAVGNGHPQQARNFIRDFKPRFPVQAVGGGARRAAR